MWVCFRYIFHSTDAMEKYICMRGIEWIPEIKVGDVVHVYISHRSPGSAMVVAGNMSCIIGDDMLDTHFEPVSSRRRERVRKAMDL